MASCPTLVADCITVPVWRRGGRSRGDDGMFVVLVLASAKLILHCYFNNRYGYFREEFDFLSCGNHLAWGFVDHPPLIPFLVHLMRGAFGDSLRVLRFVPALANSG